MHLRTRLPNTALTAEELGLHFPARQLDQIDGLLRDVALSWNVYVSNGSSKSARVFVSGGASGTGKTRFASELPQVLFNAARNNPTTPTDLVSALRECMERQLVLQIDFNAATIMEDAILHAYFAPKRTASVSRFREQCTYPSYLGNRLEQVFRLVAGTERAWRSFTGPIAVIIHLDEVQRLLDQRLDADGAARLVGSAVNTMANVLWAANNSIKLFPIFYVSGLSKTLVQSTASAAKPIPISLPLLYAEDCDSIVRSVFSFSDDWKPSAALSRALRCIAGPPRLLQLFLCALQAGGSLDNIHDAYALPIDFALLKALLNDLKWQVCTSALYRCLCALPKFRLVTFTANIASGSENLELFHHIAALVMLRHPVSLTTNLAEKVTVNDVISHGFAFSQPATDSQVYLYWPRLYIWAISKVCLFL